MHKQAAERTERILEAVPDDVATLETGVVAVVPGAGNRRLFESYGATRVIEGGQTMNPSTADIVAAIESTPADRGARAPEQLERHPLRRAGGEAHRQARPSRFRRARFRPGSPRSCATSRRSTPPRTRRRCSRRSSRSPPARSRSPRATSSSTGSTCARAPGSGSRTAQPSRPRPTSTRSRSRSPTACWATGVRCSRCSPAKRSRSSTGFLRRVREQHPGVELDVQPGGQPHYPLLLSAE